MPRTLYSLPEYVVACCESGKFRRWNSEESWRVVWNFEEYHRWT
jgi:hypothetical protein